MIFSAFSLALSNFLSANVRSQVDNHNMISILKWWSSFARIVSAFPLIRIHALNFVYDFPSLLWISRFISSMEAKHMSCAYPASVPCHTNETVENKPARAVQKLRFY
jgi:hypothetical protein